MQNTTFTGIHRDSEGNEVVIIYRNVQEIGGGVVDTGRCGAHYLQKITRIRGGVILLVTTWVPLVTTRTVVCTPYSTRLVTYHRSTQKSALYQIGI